MLDLGAGCGVTSVVAAALGARVSATDLPYSLPLLRRNVDSNAELLAAAGGSVAVGSLDWLATNDDVNKLLANVDIILAADVIWDEELVEPLLRTVERALSDTSAAGAGSASCSRRLASEQLPESCCCCCKLLATQERSAEAAQLAREMGLDGSCGALISPGGVGVICAEADWLAGQRERRVPVCYLAYTFRLDSVDAAMQRCLLGSAASDTAGRRRFCVSEVPAHRVPWQSLGRAGSAGRDCSDESSPPVRILRVQLACDDSK